ncbi:hypothetical protein C8J55DRAFT_584402, partial [Lentinula edodes]
PPIHVPSPQRSPSRYVAKGNLSHHLCESLTFQKRAVLRALQHPPVIESEDASERSTNEIAMEKLSDLLDGTATRGEGNSCLLLGPRGSGKTQTIELCISNHDGYPALTFEMLHEYVRNAIRVSAVVPVQLRGESIGMALEHLISAQIFVSLSGPSVNAGKNFLKYRCSVDREDVKKSVERNGHSSLTKFLRRTMGSR